MKRAFTLTELLIVISVIVVLAGVAIPVIGIVRRQAKDVQCRHQLAQLFTGITAYRNDSSQAFPPNLPALFDVGGSLVGEASKTLWCPHDSQHGDPFFHRNPQWGAISLPGGTSYLFEVANQVLNANERNWPLPDGGKWGDHANTWSEFKTWQLRHGGPSGAAYAENAFPILRCFFHANWSGRLPTDRTKAVVNLAWDGSVFLSVPEWENP